MKTTTSTAFALACTLAGSAAPVLAESYDITIVNATHGQVVTPPFVAVHDASVSLFQLGQSAADYLYPLAEDGDSSALVAAADATPHVHDLATGSAPIPPGGQATLTVEAADGFPLLSVAGMLATTNDAFFALNGVSLPTDDTPVTRSATVYDAGTEANTESCTTIPGPPCGSAGVRDTDGAEGFVHVHSGIHGIGDLAPATYDWRNPGVHVTIQRKP